MTELAKPSGVSIAYDWWRRLNPTDGGQSGPHRAALARIRRAATPIEVMQESEALRLIARMPRNRDRAAVLAGILAFVRETEERPVARAIGRNSLDDEQSALLSESRFRRLLQTNHDEFMDSMRRLVRVTKGTLNVRDLSSAILYWGDNVKKRWILDYYGVADSTRPEHTASATTASTQLEP